LANVIVGLRVSAPDEVEGLDLSQHGESGYIMGEGESSVSDVSHIVASSPKMSPSPARVPGRACSRPGSSTSATRRLIRSACGRILTSSCCTRTF